MKILRRYVLREHAGPFLFALTTLTSLLLLNQVARHFGDLVGKGLGWGVIGEFFLLTVPFIIAMTLPMAVLVATLYAFSRLAAENEITALRASGVSLARVLLPVLFGGAVLAAVMIAFNDQLLPRSNHRLRKLQTDIARKKPTFALREQVINEMSPGRLFLRTMHLDAGTNGLREVTIYDLSDPLRRRTIYADSGRMGMSANQSDLEMTLFDGYSQEIPKDDPGQLQRLYFDVDFIRVRGVANTLERTENDQYKSDREMTICEMQQEVNNAARERAAARFELEEMLAGVARRAATGQTREGGRPPPSSPPFALGQLYCDFAVKLLHVDSAIAAQQGGNGAGGAGIPPSAGYSPSSGMPSTDVSTAVYNVAPDGSIAPMIARLDHMRARITDARAWMNRYDVEIQKKLALAFACIVFVLIGAPIALRFPRGGVGLVIGVSLGVFGLYYIGLVAGEALADDLILHPFWAMWLTNVLFTIVGFVLLARMGREGATSRGGDLGEFWDSLRAWLARQARRIGIPLDRRKRAS